MMAVLSALSAPLSTLAATAAKKPSGSSATLLILVVIAAGFYFLILRPQRMKAKNQQQLVKQFEVGDEVLTAGGIVGHIIDIDGDRVTLETSMGASFVVLRQYVIRKLSVDVPADDEHDDDQHDDDEHDDDEHDDNEHDGDEHDGDEHDGTKDPDADDHGPKTST
jgi:preprotein translocase subunit YajC